MAVHKLVLPARVFGFLGRREGDNAPFRIIREWHYEIARNGLAKQLVLKSTFDVVLQRIWHMCCLSIRDGGPLGTP